MDQPKSLVTFLVFFVAFARLSSNLGDRFYPVRVLGGIAFSL